MRDPILILQQQLQIVQPVQRQRDVQTPVGKPDRQLLQLPLPLMRPIQRLEPRRVHGRRRQRREEDAQNLPARVVRAEHGAPLGDALMLAGIELVARVAKQLPREVPRGRELGRGVGRVRAQYVLGDLRARDDQRTCQREAHAPRDPVLDEGHARADLAVAMDVLDEIGPVANFLLVERAVREGAGIGRVPGKLLEEGGMAGIPQKPGIGIVPHAS